MLLKKSELSSLSSTARKNIICSYFILPCTFPQIALAVWSYFARDELGFTQTQALLLSWGVFIVSILAEFPTGMFADKVGKRTAVIVGAIGIILAQFSWLVFDSFWAIGFFQIVGGIGASFISGAHDALVHDSLEEEVSKSEKVEQLYSVYQSHKMAIFFAARVVLSVLGAWLFTINVYIPYWIGFFMALVLLVCAWLLQEATKENQESEQRYFRTALTEIFSGRLLLFFFMTALVQLVVSDFLFSQYQPFGILIGASATTISIMYAFQSFVSFTGSFVTKVVVRKQLAPTWLFVASLSSLFAAYLFTLHNIWLAVVGASLIGFSAGSIFSLFSIAAIATTPKHVKATALSIASFSTLVASMIAGIVASVMIDRYGADRSFDLFFLIGLCFLPVSIIGYVMSLNTAKKKKLALEI